MIVFLQIAFMVTMLAVFRIGLSQNNVLIGQHLHYQPASSDPVTSAHRTSEDLYQQLSGKYVCESAHLLGALTWIHRRQLCDSTFQCPLGDDEFKCPKSHTILPSPTPIPAPTAAPTPEPSCSKGLYRCAGDLLHCIPLSQICDGTEHCPRGEDEHGYVKVCQKREYQCDTAPVTCIQKSQVCDGYVNCPRGEDEEGCPIKVEECDMDHLRCRDTSGHYMCAKRCDGRAECYDGEDETVENCNCRNGSISCILTNGTVGCAAMCNNLITGTPPECRDSHKDEPHTLCSCPDGQIRCTLAGIQVPGCAIQCDGKKQCNDTRDESLRTCAGRCDDLHIWCLRTNGTYGCATRCNGVTECYTNDDEQAGVCRYPNRTACPDGWISWGVGKRCYFYNTEFEPWDIGEALEYCMTTFNASLAVAQSKAENDFFIYMGKQICCFTIFMGITDALSEGVWKVISTGDVAPYTNFHPGDVASNDDTKNCAVFHDDQWEISDCLDWVHILCEKGQDEF